MGNIPSNNKMLVAALQEGIAMDKIIIILS